MRARRVLPWWALFGFSFGFLGSLGFFVAAIRTGKTKYRVFLWDIRDPVLIFFVTVVATPTASLASNLAAIPFFLAWLGPTIHAAKVNREYLRTLAYKNA